MTRQEIEDFYFPLYVELDDLVTIHDVWRMDELEHINCVCGKAIAPGEFCVTVWFHFPGQLFFCQDCYEKLKQEYEEE